jgi:hypothetical protein
MVIAAHRALVHEVNVSANPFRQPAELGKGAFEVFLECLRILFIGAIDGALRRQSHLLQQTTDRALVQFHAVLLLEHQPVNGKAPKAKPE